MKRSTIAQPTMCEDCLHQLVAVYDTLSSDPAIKVPDLAEQITAYFARKCTHRSAMDR